MPIVQPSHMTDTPAGKAARKFDYRSEAELNIRAALEAWCRQRWPNGRLIHELVIARGAGRADMAVVSEDHFVAVEIKGPYDDTARLLHQIGLFRLAAPELWLVTAGPHHLDAELIRYLLPSVGVAILPGLPEHRWREDIGEMAIEVTHEADPWAPHGRCLLSVLWVEELRRQAAAHRCHVGKTHRALVDELDGKLSAAEKLRAVCSELRGREFAFRSDAPAWRADAPVTKRQKRKRRVG